MIFTGYFNWTMPGTSYGAFSRVISESDDSKAWYQFQIQLRIGRINTDNNFSEGKSQYFFFHVLQTIVKHLEGLTVHLLRSGNG